MTREYANKFYDLLGVEIFASGTHKGDKYTNADLDSMVAAYDKVGFTPPIKDGHHNDEPGMPALGWVKNVRREGSKLLADFMEMPKIVYDAIKSHKYDRVSSEIYFKFKNGAKVFDKVLKAVALLGAEIPAVRSLKPLREQFQFHENMDFEFKSYEFEVAENAYLGTWENKVYLDKLPDAAFAYVGEGGVKDEEGKTVPRELRFFPHHDIDVTNGTDSNTVDSMMLFSSIDCLKDSPLPSEELVRVRKHLRNHQDNLELTYSNEDDSIFWSEMESKHKLEKKLMASGRPKAVIGKLKGATKTSIQTLVFPKPEFTISSAKSWAKEHEFHASKVDETSSSIRLRQEDPSKFQPGSFRTISLEQGEKFSMEGIHILAGTTKNSDGVHMQSISFDSSLWDAKTSARWMESHNHTFSSNDIKTEGNSIVYTNSSGDGKVDLGSVKIIPYQDSTTDWSGWSTTPWITQQYDELKMEDVKMDEKLKQMQDAIDNLTKKFGEMTKEKDDQIKKLSDSNENLQKQLDESNKAVEDLKVLEADKAAIEAEKKKFSEIEEANKKLQETARVEKIKKSVDGVKLPAFRPFFQALYDNASHDPEGKVVKFSADGKDDKELSTWQIVDEFAKTMNKLADAKIFGEVGSIPELKRDDKATFTDAKAEVDRRVREYMNEKGEEDYRKAMDAVLSVDAELKKVYAES